jgi:predicted DNA-binding transcriptional regulator AlpA
LELFEPLLEALAQRTAKLVLEQLQGVKRQPEGRWAGVETAAKRMGLKTAKALWERKHSGRIPEHLYRKFGGSVRWDLEAIDQYMASLPSD